MRLILTKVPGSHDGVTCSCTYWPTYLYCVLSPPSNMLRCAGPVQDDSATKNGGTLQPNWRDELKTALMLDGAKTDAMVEFGDMRV